MSEPTLEQIDLALANAPADLPPDDRALLWIARAHALGQTVRPQLLMYLMGVSEEEAEDIFARLAERDLITRDE